MYKKDKNVFSKEIKLEEAPVYFLMDRFGYCKSVDDSTFERNSEAAIAENKFIIKCKNTGKVCIFTGTGNLHTVKMLDVPFGKFRDKGKPIEEGESKQTTTHTNKCIIGCNMISTAEIILEKSDFWANT